MILMQHSAYQLINIKYTYQKHIALQLDSLSIPANQTTTLVGANGSGKSTLLNLLAFITTPQKGGKLSFFGSESKPRYYSSLRKQVGFLPQKPYMLKGSVVQNMQLALKFHAVPHASWPEKIDSMLESLNISHLKRQQANTLSGGELQKAALARILLLQPKVLLLDEPFSYLDQQSAAMLQQFIQDYSKNPNNTLLFSTHNRLQGMALANNIISLVGGKSVATPLVNIFHGKIHDHHFNTGRLTVQLTDNIKQGHHISIDPKEIVISTEALPSSMRNHYQGRITAISEENGYLRVTLNAGEIFHAFITYQAMREMNLHLGDMAWVNFKSNAVMVI